MITTTFDLLGIRGRKVNVEVSLDPTGTPAMFFEGGSLSDAAQREVRVRVKSAIVNSGFAFPKGAVRVFLDVPNHQPGNLTPDLAVAVGILRASGQVTEAYGTAFIGELGLDGSIRSVPGVVCVARAAHVAGITTLYLPARNAAEASLVEGIEVVPVTTLTELVEVLNGTRPKPVVELSIVAPTNDLDLADIRGQEHAKRALEIAAAGGHSILFVGGPGAGKTMLARRLTTLLPTMTDQEFIEVAEVYSAAGLGGNVGRVRPFRAPHHTVSDVALVGGGSVPRPGEISLAHNGVLFLDEMPEFHRNVLAQVGHVLHEGLSVGNTARFGQIGFPARFQLVGSMSPCPCGHLGDPRRVCTCTVAQIERYRARVTPFIEDVFDLVVEVPPVAVETLRGKHVAEKSATVRERVVRARGQQVGRVLNAQLDARDLPAVAPLAASERAFLEKVVERLGLSAASYHRILKVARTVADLDGSVQVRVEHVAEAVQYSGRIVG